MSFLFVAMAAFGLGQTEGIAFINATIDPVEGGVINNGVIGFQNGVIAYVGTGPAPSGFKTVDLKGSWITPGLIDSAMTRGLKLPEPLANEARDDSTTVPTSLRLFNRKGVRPEIVASEYLDLGLALSAQHAAGFTAALMVPGSGTFRGQASLIWLQDGAPAVLRSSVGQATSFTPGVGAGFPGTTFGAIALFRQTMYDAARYQQLSAADRPKEQAPLASLAAVLTRQQPLMWAADSAREVLRAVDLTDEFAVDLTVVGGRQAWQYAEALLAAKASVIATVAIGEEPTQSTDPDAKQPEPYLAERKAAWRDDALNVVKLHRAGVPFVLSSLGDSSGNFLKNVRAVVNMGLPKAVALRAMTLGPAEMFGVQNQLGSLKVGKGASITVFSGDPMDPKSVVTHVVVGGKVVEVTN